MQCTPTVLAQLDDLLTEFLTWDSFGSKKFCEVKLYFVHFFACPGDSVNRFSSHRFFRFRLWFILMILEHISRRVLLICYWSLVIQDI